MPKLTIDGVAVTVPQGATILDAARSLNVMDGSLIFCIASPCLAGSP